MEQESLRSKPAEERVCRLSRHNFRWRSKRKVILIPVKQNDAVAVAQPYEAYIQHTYDKEHAS